MKIFYITSVLGDIGGSEIYARDVIMELAAQGHEILVATTEPYSFEEKNIQVHIIPSFGHHAFHKFTAPFFYKQIVDKAAAFRPDIIQSHSNSLIGWIGDKIKAKTNAPHVLLIEMISEKNNTLHTKLIYQIEKFLLPKLNFDKIIVWTNNMKNKFLLPWKVKGERIAVIPASLKKGNYDLNASGERIMEKYGKHLIVSIKSFWTTNVIGLKYIIKAMKFVKQRHPEYKYLCIGSGDSSALQKLAAKENVLDVVLFPQNVSNNEKKEYWAATEIAPHSFVYEFSTSISLLEFLAMGKACVVTNAGAVKEYVRDAALVVEPENPSAMANGIIKLIDDEKLRKTLEKKARKLFENEYSIQSTALKLEKIYAELMAQNERNNDTLKKELT